ncbi:hypothetical protein SK128_014235 [Halocaridina rubra]|uniref:Uncharacterized protein n=1 Tax=Halocaridina rubra TaxID=373956 RepID=A0AAN8WRD6_HALRR
MDSKGWFAYSTLSGVLFNPGIIINPGGGGGGGGSSSSSSSSSSSGGSSGSVGVFGASVSGDTPIENILPNLDPGSENDILGGNAETGSEEEPLIPFVNGTITPAVISIRPVSPTGTSVSEVTDLFLNGTVWSILANISNSTFESECSGGYSFYKLIFGVIELYMGFWGSLILTRSGVSTDRWEGSNENVATSELSILPLPEPRPPTMEGAVPISWITTIDPYGSSGSNSTSSEDPVEPTVAPSYPVLHACLVLGGDVPSCVAQAELYGQLLYEHTVNALQKPITDEATEQMHITADMIKITESSLPYDQNKKPPTKHEFLLANFPHASFVQQSGSTTTKDDVVQSGILPNTADVHKPIIQQILSQIHFAQAATPYVELVQSSVKNGSVSSGVSSFGVTTQENYLHYTPDNEKPVGLFVNHIHGTSPMKEDTLMFPPGSDITTPNSLPASQEKPPNVNLVIQAHPHAQIVTARPDKNSVQAIENAHPHGEVIANPPPNVDVIQSLYPPEHIIDALLHHYDRPAYNSNHGSTNVDPVDGNLRLNASKTLSGGKILRIKPQG